MNLATAKLYLVAAVTCTVAGPAAAQTAADDLPPALRACADEVDVMRRLSCFDREMAKLRNTPATEVETAADNAPATMEPEPAPASAAPPVAESAPPAVPATAPGAAAPPPADVAASSAPAADSAPAANAPDRGIVAAAPAAAATVHAAKTGAPPPSPEAAATPTTVEQEPETVIDVAPGAAPAATAVAANDDFGGKGTEVREMTATVTGIRTRPYGEMIILLDNGQIWEQKHLDRRFHLEVGERVTISKGLISGYRLSGKSNDSIQVERLK